MASSTGVLRNPFRVTFSKSRSGPRYQRPSFADDEGDCPFQQRRPSNANTNTSQHTHCQRPPAGQTGTKRNKDQCHCCQRKFTFLERFLSLGQKRCHECRQTICKHCANYSTPGATLCHLCVVRTRWNTGVTPEQLLALDSKQLVSILDSLHYRDTDFVGWPKHQLVKQVLTRLDIYPDWSQDWSKTEQHTPGKSPKRRKRRPSRDSSEVKRAKTSTDDLQDTRTINQVEVINQDKETTDKKTDPAPLPAQAPLTPPPPSQPQQQQTTTRPTPSNQRRSRQRDSSLTPRKLAASFRKSVYGVTPTVKTRRKGSVASLPIEDLCKICMETTPNCVFLNCGHMITCNKCAHKVTECPICRSKIAKIQKVYKA